MDTRLKIGTLKTFRFSSWRLLPPDLCIDVYSSGGRNINRYFKN